MTTPTIHTHPIYAYPGESGADAFQRTFDELDALYCGHRPVEPPIDCDMAAYVYRACVLPPGHGGGHEFDRAPALGWVESVIDEIARRRGSNA